MSLNSFERCYVINLPERTDRRREMEGELERIGLKAEFFPAFRFDVAEPFHRVGSRGSFMSHLGVLRLAKDASSVLVFEDDCDFIQDTSRFAIVKQLPSDWAIFYGSHNDALHEGPAQGLRAVAPNEELVGLHFHAVNGFAIPLLISAMEGYLSRVRNHPDGGPMPSDGALNVFRRQNPTLKTFAAVPELGFQRSSRSDCAQPKWFDRNPITSPVVSHLRKLKNALRT